MNDELQELIRTPREDLDIELKQWMNTADKVVQAKFAKELIALRNHGGGYLVVGFLDGHPPIPDINRPADLTGFSTDVINNIIKRYAEPSFHCMSYVVAHPVTGETYPVVVVPGGAKAPVRCKSDSPDGGKSAKLDVYYIRRPGPESSPPQSGSEWDALLERCLLGRKEELLTSLTSLLGLNKAGFLAGAIPQPVAHPFSELRSFRDVAVRRLEELQKANLPEGDGARFEYGRYILSARLIGDIKAVTSPEMLGLLSGLRRYTGWSPLYIFSRPELEPYLVDDHVIECWLARDEARDTAHADFWRVSTDGMVCLVRGHQEDAPEITQDGRTPGTGIELTLPPWRIAEFVLRIRELGEKLVNGAFAIQLIVQWEGIDGRVLFSHGGRRALFENYVAHGSDYSVETEITPDDVDAALPSILANIVTPLLRRFSFFEPPADFYKQELARLMKRDYA